MDRVLSFDDNGIGTPSMQCPSCGDPMGLHHEDAPVDVWQRGEDAECVGYAVLPGGEGVKAIPGEGNPSGRRSGLRLHFWCELCHTKFALAIAQHKGQTLVTLEPEGTLVTGDQ